MKKRLAEGSRATFPVLQARAKRKQRPWKANAGFGYIYVVACDPWPGQGAPARIPCKIGLTGEPNKRLTQIQILHPFRVRLVALFPGTPAVTVESALHDEFEEHRIRGEWFHLSREHLADLAARMGRDYREWVEDIEARAERRAGK